MVAARSNWNRLRREAGSAGMASAAFAAVIITLSLVVPGLMVYRISRTIFEELLATGDPDVIVRWNGLQALFTLGFAAFAIFRYRITFRFSDIGRLPVLPGALLLAEIPATLFEVFPMLACVGIVASSMAVVTSIPSFTPVVAIVTLLEVTVFVTIVYAGFGLKSILQRHRSLLYVIVIAGGALLYVAGFERCRLWLREELPAIVSWSPVSLAWDAAFGMMAGFDWSVVARLAVVSIVTLVGFATVARFHYRTLRSELDGANDGGRRSERSHFGHPVLAVGRLFQHQLSDSKFGKVALFLAAFYSVPLAIMVWLIGRATSENGVLPEEVVGTVEFVKTLPLLAIVFVLVIVFDSEVWMNQFGRERGGVRTLFNAPITSRTILLGHLVGVGGFMLRQAVIGIVPLLTFYRPTFLEGLAAIGGAISFGIVAIGTGQYFSGRFPRAIERDGTSSIPLYLSWIPMIVIGGSLMFFAPIFKASHRMGWGIPAGITVATAVVTVGVYFAVLRVLCDELEKNRERVIGM